MAWNPCLAYFSGYVACAGLLLKGKFINLDVPIHLLNIYAPYSQRELFWDLVVLSGVLSLPNLIVAGDLNFTWSVEEVWGSCHAFDPLSGYFPSIFNNANLVDISPTNLSPTWSNGRCGAARIAKQLDRYFMVESLCEIMG